MGPQTGGVKFSKRGQSCSEQCSHSVVGGRSTMRMKYICCVDIDVVISEVSSAPTSYEQMKQKFHHAIVRLGKGWGELESVDCC